MILTYSHICIYIYICPIGHYRWTQTLGRFRYVSIHCPFKGHPSRCRYKASGSAARGPRDSGRLRGAAAVRRKMSCTAVPARLSRPRSCEAIAWYHVLYQCFHHITSFHRSVFYMVACIQISKWIKRRQLKVKTYSKLTSTCLQEVRTESKGTQILNVQNTVVGSQKQRRLHGRFRGLGASQLIWIWPRLLTRTEAH